MKNAECNQILKMFKKKLYHTAIIICSIFFFMSCNKENTLDPEDDTTVIEDDDPIIPGDPEIDWIKTFGGSGEDNAVSVVEASDGGYVILGSTKSNDGDVSNKTTNDSDYWILKLNPEGEKLWNKVYGGSADDNATHISNTSDGGYIVSGYSRSNDGDVSGNEGFHDYWIVKLDASGNIQWEQNEGFAGSDQAFDVFETSDGGFFVTGFFDFSASDGQGNDLGKSTLHGVGEFWAVRLDNSGTKLWRRYFGGTNNDRSYSALETNNGDFLMVGSSESDDFDITDAKGSYDFWVVRITSEGDLMWTKSFGGAEIDIGYSVCKSADGNFIMVGDSRSQDQDVSTSLGNADAWVIKFNGDGDLLWERSFGGSNFESARSISKMNTGNYLIAGNSRSLSGDLTDNNGANDAWIFIITESGTIDFQYSVGGSGLDFANQAIQTSDNKILVVGETESNDFDILENKGSKDFLVIKFKQ